MKYTIATAAALALLSAPALAGDYHSGSTLNCQDCHIMHYSVDHTYQQPIAGGPYHYLLRGEINDLCLSCHDNQTFAPDVLETITPGGNNAAESRNAGALNRDFTGGYAESDGHTLGSLDAAPGGTWTPTAVIGLQCTDCHAQHGRAGSGGAQGTGSLYRNLNSDVGDNTWGDYEITYVNSTTTPAGPFTDDVWQASATGLVWDESQVEYLEQDTAASPYAAWCGGCHTNFHGTPGDGGGATGVGGIGGVGAWVEFERHPVNTVNLGDIGGGHSNLNMYTEGNAAGTVTGKANWIKAMSEDGNWGAAATLASGITPSCMSCHKAHGNQNPYGLIWRSGTGNLTEEGDDGGAVLNSYANLCGQCHVQAGFFAVP